MDLEIYFASIEDGGCLIWLEDDDGRLFAIMLPATEIRERMNLIEGPPERRVLN